MRMCNDLWVYNLFRQQDSKRQINFYCSKFVKLNGWPRRMSRFDRFIQTSNEYSVCILVVSPFNRTNLEFKIDAPMLKGKANNESPFFFTFITEWTLDDCFHCPLYS